MQLNMKTIGVFLLVAMAWTAQAQSLVGTWQVTDEKTCFQSEMNESETEKELLPMMGGTANSTARLITFDKKGRGQEGIFSRGNRKGTGMEAFTYKTSGSQLMITDPKSGIITEQWVIDELSSTTLRMHNEKKDCESKTLNRVK